jgi:hypothetical protein
MPGYHATSNEHSFLAVSLPFAGVPIEDRFFCDTVRFRHPRDSAYITEASQHILLDQWPL